MKNLLTVLSLFVMFSTYSQTTIKPIPFKSNALFWLDGKVSKIGANYYFIDKTGNGRNFLITGYDFDSTSAIKGFPYKSAATISAPIGDAILIAADVNSFLYTSSTPNQIPVVSLFQDIDYEHKLFTRHKLQTVSNDSIETFEPRVYDVVLYNSIKTSLDLTKCQSYYRVPTEISGAIWYSPSGNNTTGTGTKSNPYQTLAKNTTAHTNVYCKSGTYELSVLALASTASLVNIYGTGFVKFGYFTSGTLHGNRPVRYKNIIISGNGSSTHSMQPKYGITFENCSLIKTSGTNFINTTNGGVMGDIIAKNCIFSFVGSASGLFNTDAIPPNVSIVGCYGTLLGFYLPLSRINTSVNIAHCKLTNSLEGVYSYGIRFQDNKVSGNSKIICAQNSNIKYNKFDSIVITTAAGTNFYKNIARNVVFANCANSQTIRGNTITPNAGNIGLMINAAHNSNYTGLVIDSNTVIGNTQNYLVYVSTFQDLTLSGYVDATFKDNYIVNTSVGTEIYRSVFLRGKFKTVTNNNLLGAGLQTWTVSNASISNNYIRASQYVRNIERSAIIVYDSTGNMANNVNILNNTFIGSMRYGCIVLIGSHVSETDTNAFDSLTFANNKVVNEHDSTLSGSAHTIMFDAGKNFNIKYNDITFSQGYGIVLKAGGGHYLYDIPHISYNVFRNTGNATFIVYCRGAYGANFTNNTILNYKGFSCFNSDGNFSGLEDNQLIVKNNLIQLGGNVANCYSASSPFIITANNYYAKNGFVFTGVQQGVSDFVTLTSINSDGVPISRINGGLSTIVTQGIGVNYSIPNAPLYNNQDATWQVGAIVK